MMITYPNTLRLPLFQGYSREVEPGFEDVEPLSGPAYRVRNSFDCPARFQLQFQFTEGQQEIFWDWFRNELNAGFEPFEMALRLESGNHTQVCRFARDGLPRLVSVQGGHYRYSATVLVDQVTDPDTGQYQTLLYSIQFAIFIEFAALIDSAVNNEWPEA